MRNIKLFRVLVYSAIFLLVGVFSEYLEYKVVRITPKILILSLIGGFLESIVYYLLKKADK